MGQLLDILMDEQLTSEEKEEMIEDIEFLLGIDLDNTAFKYLIALSEKLADNDLGNNDDIEVPKLKGKVKKSTDKGRVTIKFNSEMKKLGMNLTEIDDKLMEVYVKPSNDWHLYERDFNVSPALNLTWKVFSFEKDTMILDLMFNSSLDISPKTMRDSLVIHFKNSFLWLITIDGRVLEPIYETIEADLPKQMPETNALNSADVAKDVLKATALVATLTAPASFASLYLIVSMINHLQIVIHLPLVSVSVAANMLAIQKILITLVTYDLISED